MQTKGPIPPEKRPTVVLTPRAQPVVLPPVVSVPPDRKRRGSHGYISPVGHMADNLECKDHRLMNLEEHTDANNTMC